MTRACRILVLAALSVWSAGPLMAQNLLTNGDFDLNGQKPIDGNDLPVANITGWTTNGGPTPKYNGTTHVPTPPGSNTLPGGIKDDGTASTPNRASVDEGTGGTSTARIVQTKSVAIGQQVIFTGWIAGADTNGSGSYHHRAILRDGGVGGTILAQFEFVGNSYTWRSFSIGGIPTQNTVTVEWGHGDGAPGPYHIVATHVDQLKLEVAGGTCTNQTTIDTVTPDTYNVPPQLGASELITITGTNLNVAEITPAGVNLQGPAIIPATSFDSQTAGQIQARFNLSAAPLGSYNLVINRNSPCVNASKANAVTLQCTCPPSTLATVQNDRGLSGNASHTITLTGANLDCLSSVKLKKTNDGGAEIPGVLGAAGSGATSRTVTFDLTGAEGGRYNVIAAHPCGQVTPAAGLTRAFLVYMPALTNPSFEEGWSGTDPKTVLCPQTSGSNPKPKHWDVYQFTSPFQGGFKRDGNVGAPDCIGTSVKNMTGSHYGGLDVNAFGTIPGVISFFQTIDASPLLSGGQLVAPFNIRAELDFDDMTTATCEIRLIGDTEVEGDLNPSTVLGTISIPATTEPGLVTDPSFNALIPAGTTWPTTGPALLTIEFRFIINQAGLGGFWVDNVRTGPFVPPGCNTPFGDVDGDDDMDLNDYSVFQRCYTGAAGTIPVDPLYCSCFDRNGDLKIEQVDFNAFVACATRDGVAVDTINPPPGCDP